MAQAQSLPFEQSTRLKWVKLNTLTRPTVGGGITSLNLPKTGILACIMLPISITVGGVVNTPNALGLATAINRVQLSLNSGYNVFDFSGVGYHYLIRESLEEHANHLNWTDARSAVTTGAKRLDMIIPVSQNMRDQVGMIMLQNEATLAELRINWESEVTVGGSTATITAGSCTPMIGIFEVPQDPGSWPSFNTLHQLIEEQQAVSAAGDFDHQIQRGATLISQQYLFSPGYTAAKLYAQQSNILEDWTPEGMRLRFDLTHQGRDITLAGALTSANSRIDIDLAGTDGLGEFGTVRDVIDTSRLTSLFTRITAVGAGTLFAVRRQITPLA